LSIYTLAARSMSRKYFSSSILKETNLLWNWRVGMTFLCLSKRIHSIFVLRLFNDAPAMLLFYVSTYLFMKSKWKIGCLFFSLAVSIKMNVLLFAPGLLLLLLQASQNLIGTILCLGICAIVQIILGAPFLLTFPVSYIRKAFELDRVFFFQWTVNWKFLPEIIFVSKPLSLLLLGLHVGALAIFAKKWIQSAKNQKIGEDKVIFLGSNLSPVYVVYTLFISNFIGIAFARTLHYQFYSWYFHSLPLLLLCTKLPALIMVVMLVSIEYSFNVFPATPLSSGILQCSHLLLLVASYYADVPHILNKRVKQS